ncbi:MAG: cytochrome c-type biogenesis protein CcmH [Kiritimatiellia bacterium]|jgi:cytochrome c-type biogenesis protein CcmH
MTLFYVGVSVLLLLALLFILWEFVSWEFIFPGYCARRRYSSADLRESTNVALYRDHLAEIEQSFVSGNINQAQYDQLIIELERNLVEDSQLSVTDAVGQEKNNGKNGYFLAAIVVVLVVSAGGIYSQLGAYEAWQVKTALDKRGDLEQQYLLSADPALQSQIVESNRELVVQLRLHVAKSPEDLQMRALLARTALGLGDYGLAIEHFQGILSQEPELSQIMAELAQAVFLKANNRVVPIVQSLVDQTLKLEPNNTIALGLAGIGAFQSEKFQQAINFWQQAIVIQGATSPNSIALQSGITAAQQRLGVEDTTEVAADVQPATQQQAKADGGSEPSITVSVSLANDVKLAPEATVFIYARAWQGAKIPLSIARVEASQLPVTLTLTNTMSMAPSVNLSSASQLELVARVSVSGTPVPQSGDWQVTLGPVETRVINTQPYSLLIAEQVP